MDKAIDFLFGYLYFKRSNFYSSFNHISLASWRKEYPEIVDKFDSILKEKLTTKSFSNLIYLIFTEFDVCKRGRLVHNIFKDIKSNYDKIWFAKDNQPLVDLCKNIIIDESNNTVTINTQVSSVNNENPNKTLTYAEILKLNKDHLDEVKKLISSQNSLNQTSDNKNNHYNELKSLLDKYQRYKNSETINKGYKNANIFQESLHSSKFPEPMYKHDAEYKLKFNKLIEEFQNKIRDFNIDFMNDQLDLLTDQILQKSNVIKLFDNEYD